MPIEFFPKKLNTLDDLSDTKRKEDKTIKSDATKPIALPRIPLIAIATKGIETTVAERISLDRVVFLFGKVKPYLLK